jgi:hypothetical protein
MYCNRKKIPLYREKRKGYEQKEEAHLKPVEEKGKRMQNHEVHCTKNPIYVFPETKLRGLVPNSYINVSVSVLYIPRIGLPIWLQKIGRPILGIYKLLTDT